MTLIIGKLDSRFGNISGLINCFAHFKAFRGEGTRSKQNPNHNKFSFNPFFFFFQRLAQYGRNARKVKLTTYFHEFSEYVSTIFFLPNIARRHVQGFFTIDQWGLLYINHKKNHYVMETSAVRIPLPKWE